MTYTEHDSIYLLDLAVLAALETQSGQSETALQVTLDEYQLQIDDNAGLWRNIVEVAAIQIAALTTQFLGAANATQITQTNMERYLERD